MSQKVAIVYVRVSTTDQANEGVSLEAQAAKGREWASLNGFEVSNVHVDAGVSGKTAANRPGLLAALDEVCREKGVLVVYSLSRFARSTRETLELADRIEKSGADLVSLSEKIDTTTAAGKMVFRMLAVLAEFERDQISERTKAALAHKKSKGERVGQIPFGFRLNPDGVTLVEDRDEQRVLDDLATMRAAGWSWRRIAEELNRRGLTTKNGRPWSLYTARLTALAA